MSNRISENVSTWKISGIAAVGRLPDGLMHDELQFWPLYLQHARCCNRLASKLHENDSIFECGRPVHDLYGSM